MAIVPLVITCLVVVPMGNFPLNDDWIGAEMVQEVMTTGAYPGHDFMMIVAIVPVYWGALWATLLGPSYEALRAGTLVMAALLLVGTALAARALGASKPVSLLCSFALAANPFFLNLSYTFMTDVPFMAMAGVAGLFYLRALESRRARDILLGSAFGVLALWSRQFGLMLAPAFLLALAADWPRWREALAARHVAAFAVPWTAGVAVSAWFMFKPGATLDYAGHASDLTFIESAAAVVRFVPIPLLYLGLFAIPVLCLAVLAGGGRVKQRGPWILGVIFAAYAGAAGLHFGRVRMPVLGNMLYDLGVGPPTLSGTYVPFASQNLGMPAALGDGVWYAVTGIALVCGALVIAQTARLLQPEESGRRAQRVYLAAWAIALCAAPYNPWVAVYYDRYLLPATVPVLLYLAMDLPQRIPKKAWAAAGIVCTAMLTFSLCALHDYMAWNTERWNAAIGLVQYGVEADALDGGYEYNAVHTRRAYLEAVEAGAIDPDATPGWWVIDDRYALAFAPREGFETVSDYPFDTWLPHSIDRILLLKRTDKAP